MQSGSSEQDIASFYSGDLTVKDQPMPQREEPSDVRLDDVPRTNVEEHGSEHQNIRQQRTDSRSLLGGTDDSPQLDNCLSYQMSQLIQLQHQQQYQQQQHPLGVVQAPYTSQWQPVQVGAPTQPNQIQFLAPHSASSWSFPSSGSAVSTIGVNPTGQHSFVAAPFHQANPLLHLVASHPVRQETFDSRIPVHNVDTTRVRSSCSEPVNGTFLGHQRDNVGSTLAIVPFSGSDVAVCASATAVQGTEGQNPSANREDKVPAVTKPKRPLSAYNIFFQQERQKLLNEIPSDESKTRMKLMKRNKNPKRGEPHGKMSFESLAKTIGERWKSVKSDSTLRSHFEDLAERDKKRYQGELAVWKQQESDTLTEIRERLEHTVGAKTKEEYFERTSATKGKR